MSFANRTVMVTGAAGQLGRAVVANFQERGANLVLLDRDLARLQALYGLDARLLLVAADLTDTHQSAAAVAAASERFGGVDVLCHLAGGFRMGEAVHETSDATLDFLYDINVRTFVAVARAVVPGLLAQGGGRIVAVGAHAAARGVAQMGAYCAAKSSLVRLVEAMAAELRERNVNVNCVLPTIIDTPENRAAMPDADPSRWVDPKALAEAISFLCSDAARAVHGAALPVSGLS